MEPFIQGVLSSESRLDGGGEIRFRDFQGPEFRRGQSSGPCAKVAAPGAGGKIFAFTVGTAAVRAALGEALAVRGTGARRHGEQRRRNSISYILERTGGRKRMQSEVQFSQGATARANVGYTDAMSRNKTVRGGARRGRYLNVRVGRNRPVHGLFVG